MKKAFAALVLLEDQMRKILVEASLEIFQKFEKQLTGVVDADSSSWKRGVEKLAIDAASRVINYISVSNEKGEFPVSHITKGVVLGESKKRRLATCFGYRVKDKQSGEISLTSALYGNVGIKKIEDNATNTNSHY
ncbi:hypothetical protein [Wolbachia endosymbiont (group B) of Gerris lacustris]|uniref:hypothetical protein n=1 Tax=Wolbachia endosymbiont (group B) of Gerris lacustris TaxID=3066159 RepID=UPI0033412A5B